MVGGSAVGVAGAGVSVTGAGVRAGAQPARNMPRIKSAVTVFIPCIPKFLFDAV